VIASIAELKAQIETLGFHTVKVALEADIDSGFPTSVIQVSAFKGHWKYSHTQILPAPGQVPPIVLDRIYEDFFRLIATARGK